MICEGIATVGDQAPLVAALLQARQAFKPVYKSNDAQRWKFADLRETLAAVEGALTSNGLTILQLPVSAPAGSIGVATRLAHSSGAYIESVCTMPVDPMKGQSKAQAAGSSLTYARRYAITSLLMLAAEDTDGAGAVADPETGVRPTRDGMLMELRSVGDIEALTSWAKDVEAAKFSGADREILGTAYKAKVLELQGPVS